MAAYYLFIMVTYIKLEQEFPNYEARPEAY